MYMRTIFTSLIILLNVLTSCGKGGDSPVAPVSTAPTNLTLTATVNADNTGNVAFKATATNAALYTFDLGNGVNNQVSVDGSIAYKYSASGVYTVSVVAKSASGKTAVTSTVVNVIINRVLVWADEFDVAGAPDATKWGFDTGGGGWGNNELQNYTNRSDNSVVSGGTLKIIAKKESFGGSNYTSARLLSKGKFSFKYGRVEARAKLPATAGTWPALWMLGDNFLSAGWPACGEIDIMEHVGNSLNKIYGTLHYPDHSGGNAVGGTTMITNAATEFHKYAMEWNDTNIKFYVDDVLFFTFANTTAMPFNQNFFLIVNQALGGGLGGAIDPAFTSATYEVDYIRVYQ